MEKTPSQLKKKYRAIQYSCFAGEFLSAAAPFVAIAIANYEKYFVEYDGMRVSISFVMAMAVMGFAIFGIAKKKMNNSFVTLIIIWATMAFIFTMLGHLITDLATIMWFGLIGITGAAGLDIVSKKAEKAKNKITAAQEQAANEDMVEAVKEEKKIKVKVIKK